MMRVQRLMFVVLAGAIAGSISFAQVGRGGSQWLTALADAQRTSWIRTDDRISVDALSKGGFELQWKVKLDNQPRGAYGLSHGVSGAGVTLFVPISLVTGSSNNVYALDNDTGYVVWQRHFAAALPTATGECAGGMTSGGTRIVRLEPVVPPPAQGFGGGGRATPGYRSVLGEPGQGVPLEARGRAAAPPAPPPQRGGETAPVPPAGERGAARGERGVAAGGQPLPGARAGQAGERIPGSPRREEPAGFGFLARPSGVGYVITSDGMLHVVGLPSGKDIQRPAQFLPANAKWSAPIAVNTTLYTATSGNCGGAPSGVWAIDLDSDQKPVTSWKTQGGSVVGTIAFGQDGTLFAAIGPGRASGEGKANAIVALDPQTLRVKDWYTEPTAEFATGPTILRHNDKTIVAAATKDGRVILLDGSSLGGANHSTALHISKPVGATLSAEALAAWQQTSPAASWLLVPVKRPTRGASSRGAVAALKVAGSGDAISLETGWASQDLPSPATPITVNGVVFTLTTGAPAVLHAYDGATGKRLWSSGTAMTGAASPGSFWSTLGQVYVGMHDGTLHTFGFNDERKHTTGQ